MNCPACSRELNRITVEGVTVDVCREGCGGIWFDNFELRKFDEPQEHAGEALLAGLKQHGIAISPAGERRGCPLCSGQIMMQHLFSPNDPVQIDECPMCGGVFLDAGELEAIRARFSSEGERKEAAEKFLADKFDAAFAAMKRESEAERRRTDRLYRMMRFVCPSYYLKD